MDFTQYLRVLENISTRYFVTAGIAFSLFYILFRHQTLFKKIQSKFPNNEDYVREISYSALSMLIFAIVPTLVVFNPAVRPHTLLLNSPYQFGAFYFWFAFVLLFFMHDFYFYWIHRAMHHPVLFKYFHLVHHKSINPSPWAAYSFHPLEAFLEIGIYFIFVFCVPVHIYHIITFFLFQILYNVYGHLGYEIFPANFNRNAIGKWFNTSVAHNQHHKYFEGNYGLYTVIWDRLFGTMRSDYDALYDAVKNIQPALNTVEERNPDAGGKGVQKQNAHV